MSLDKQAVSDIPTYKDFDIDDGTNPPDGVAILMINRMEKYSIEQLIWFADQLKIPQWQNATESKEKLMNEIRDYLIHSNPFGDAKSPFDPMLPTLYIFEEPSKDTRYFWKYNNGSLYYTLCSDPGNIPRYVSYKYYPRTNFEYQFNRDGKMSSRWIKIEIFAHYEYWDHNYKGNVYHFDAKSSDFLPNDNTSEQKWTKDNYQLYLKEMNEQISSASGLFKPLVNLIVDHLYPSIQTEKKIDWPGSRYT